jgi:condensin complex subunit 3
MLRHYEEQEYILKQLLLICKLLDFTDEAGRRNLYSVLRETIPKLHLPNETALIALGVLNQVQPSEDEFLR